MGIVLGAVLSGLLASAAAGTPQASGSIVINGKTIALTQGRAWQAGHMMGIPMVDIMLAEKSLKDVDWWKSSDAIADGKLGVVLRLKPSNDLEDKPGQPVFHYVFNENYQIELYAGDFGGWSQTSLEKADITMTDFSVSKGVVSGKLEWKGKAVNPYDETQSVTAWSASFSLPLDEVGELPK